MRPVKAGANTAIGYAHKKKIYQAEDENIGIKAAHRTELVGEAGLRTAYHRHKTAPYRRVSKLQQKSVRANAGLSYRQALYDNPELKKNVLARMWQKQKLKRQYAKAAREAKKSRHTGKGRRCHYGKDCRQHWQDDPAAPGSLCHYHSPAFGILPDCFCLCPHFPILVPEAWGAWRLPPIWRRTRTSTRQSFPIPNGKRIYRWRLAGWNPTAPAMTSTVITLAPSSMTLTC